MDFKGLKVTVVGMARSGVSAALFLKSTGADVFVTDNNINEEIKKNSNILKDVGIEFETGKHTEFCVKGRGLIVISPGVARDSVIIKWAIEYGIPVISELELGYLFCKGRIIAVTGTNGKTTTVQLIGNIIKESGNPVIVCGNVGTPFTSQIPEITSQHYVVLEVSSFQLEWIDMFRPHIAAILNITDDHMDRYKDLGEYMVEKAKIFINQEEEDFLVLNHEDPILKSIEGDISPKRLFFGYNKNIEGIFSDGKEIAFSIGKKVIPICSFDTARLRGLHNLQNVMASILVCKLAGIKTEDIVRGVSSFIPLPHRFQHVAEIEGVEFINDSKATNVDATLKALASLDRPTILIAGGRNKGSDFSVAKDIIKEKVASLILIGEAKNEIKDQLKDSATIHNANTLEEAVELAYNLAKNKEIVLLSPMCASFDMFKDYTERGDVFIDTVTSLKERVCAKYGSQS